MGRSAPLNTLAPMALVTRLCMLVRRASDQFAIAHTQVVFWRIATLCAHQVSEHLSSRVAEIALRRLLLCCWWAARATSAACVAPY